LSIDNPDVVDDLLLFKNSNQDEYDTSLKQLVAALEQEQ
jgi:hypothetical protein